MRTLCSKPGKGGGKIHPSPAEDPIGAAFRLLPAAILVLVAGLGPEDREVLAYLVTLPAELAKEAAAVVPLSDHPPAPARGGGGARSCRRRAGGCAAPAAIWSVDHLPALGCGCFECYTSFWARWDRSPARDRIHEAVEAFEDHLTAAEPPATPPQSSTRRRARRSRLQATPSPPPPLPPPLPMLFRVPKLRASQVTEVVQAPASALPPSSPPPLPSQAPAEEENEDNVAPEPAEQEECREVAADSAEEERKRGWAGVMGGLLGLRLWGIWSPPVESAT